MVSRTPPLPASSPLPPAPAPGAKEPPVSGDPASQLVTELFESIKLKSDTDKPCKPSVSKPSEPKHQPVTDFKAGLRKVNQHPLSGEKCQEQAQQVNFKSQLKKTNTSLYAQPQHEDQDHDQGKVDFKAQLKKVKEVKVKAEPSDGVSESQDLNNVKASLRSVSKHSIEQVATEGDDKGVEGEDKRKSTGSISSLKKMWEDGQPAEGGNDDRPGSVVKFEKRVWPPIIPTTETEKPMVPVKPTVKPPPTSKPPKEPSCKPPPKPSPASKPMVCNIYAAPNSVPPKPNISSIKPKMAVNSKNGAASKTGDSRADSTDSGLSSANDKESVMDLSVGLENILDSLAKEGGITKTSAMTASDKVKKLQNSFVDCWCHNTIFFLVINVPI